MRNRRASPDRAESMSSMPQPEEPDKREPGGPYFGRLLIVLFLAVAFCALLTWVVTTYMQD